jgi:hypothetical protein
MKLLPVSFHHPRNHSRAKLSMLTRGPEASINTTPCISERTTISQHEAVLRAEKSLVVLSDLPRSSTAGMVLGCEYQESHNDSPYFDHPCDCDDEDSCCNENQGERSPTRKRVSFADVEVRQYSITIGDHPCCVMGCPLSLDWGYSICRPLSLEAYEAQRPARRSRLELLTTCEERRRILADDGGYSEGEIRKANRKLHRARTCPGRLCDKLNETFFSEYKLSPTAAEV